MYIGIFVLLCIAILMWLKKINLSRRDKAIERMMDERFRDLFADIERISKKQDDGREKEKGES